MKILSTSFLIFLRVDRAWNKVVWSNYFFPSATSSHEICSLTKIIQRFCRVFFFAPALLLSRLAFAPLTAFSSVGIKSVKSFYCFREFVNREIFIVCAELGLLGWGALMYECHSKMEAISSLSMMVNLLCQFPHWIPGVTLNISMTPSEP